MSSNGKVAYTCITPEGDAIVQELKKVDTKNVAKVTKGVANDKIMENSPIPGYFKLKEEIRRIYEQPDLDVDKIISVNKGEVEVKAEKYIIKDLTKIIESHLNSLKSVNIRFEKVKAFEKFNSKKLKRIEEVLYPYFYKNHAYQLSLSKPDQLAVFLYESTGEDKKEVKKSK